ncbi:hypothetical protein [Kordia periserrulae]|uniref:hypothetical protein n=1 Tax=Kordia periserrulae TaxID=701523 RepID=UPI0011B241AC|nr:hypothetical protein [Kordia periserrulae]
MIAILFYLTGFAQYSTTTLQTDSTKVEITKNSEYRIWEETYLHKDSIFYSVRYIKDTTKIHTEGWFRKNEQYMGKWSKYKIDGTWLYTIDYDKHTWKYNKKEFKYQPLKDQIKTKADTILLNIFGKEFFDNNIVFNFDGSTSFNRLKTCKKGTYWMQDPYLGSWIEPIHQKPNTFSISYDVKLSDHELYNDLIFLELDSVGKLKEKSLILTKINHAQKGKFTITKEKAIEICKQNTLKKSNREYKTYLKFGHRANTPYTGTFFYEVVQQYEEVKDENEIIRFFNIWRFNPWSTKLLSKKQMKKEYRLYDGCLTSSNFIEVKE